MGAGAAMDATDGMCQDVPLVLSFLGCKNTEHRCSSCMCKSMTFGSGISWHASLPQQTLPKPTADARVVSTLTQACSQSRLKLHHKTGSLLALLRDDLCCCIRGLQNGIE